MKPRTYSSEAVVLARKDYSEADRILIIFSKDFGKLALIAKGVRKPQSRKRGHIEVFNLMKFSAARTKSLDLITEAEIVDSFTPVRKNLKKVALAYYFVEIVGRITHENEPNQELFDLIVSYLKRLEQTRSLKKLRLDFVIRLLAVTGFWPRGKVLANPDLKLEEVLERRINSLRVGKRILD